MGTNWRHPTGDNATGRAQSSQAEPNSCSTNNQIRAMQGHVHPVGQHPGASASPSIRWRHLGLRKALRKIPFKKSHIIIFSKRQPGPLYLLSLAISLESFSFWLLPTTCGCLHLLPPFPPPPSPEQSSVRGMSIRDGIWRSSFNSSSPTSSSSKAHPLCGLAAPTLPSKAVMERTDGWMMTTNTANTRVKLQGAQPWSKPEME